MSDQASSSISRANGQKKLHGRAFYQSIGSPKLILAPMVEQSEFAWRMLTRSFLPSQSRSALLAYTPMFHSRLWVSEPKVSASMFQPVRQVDDGQKEELWLDGNPACDRPLFVQFCSNDPDMFLAAAKTVVPYCDAVDLNLGCPQGIAKSGRYGAFLQEDQKTIYELINRLHKELPIPVTAKMRILETKEKTLEYAKLLLSAGASIITVHGRQRHMKKHLSGIADWSVIRYLRDNLPQETVLFANGNILQYEDIQRCLDATGADGVMSAEGNLHDPAIFASPPLKGCEGREYWRGVDGKGGWRIDAVVRRYLDIIYRHVLNQESPARKPLFLPSDPPNDYEELLDESSRQVDEAPPQKKRRIEKKMEKKQNKARAKVNTGPNFPPMKGHMFALLRTIIGKHTQITSALGRCYSGDMAAFENVLRMVEAETKAALIDYEKSKTLQAEVVTQKGEKEEEEDESEERKKKTMKEREPEFFNDPVSTKAAKLRCGRPWWVCQPYIRPFPNEVIPKTAQANDGSKLDGQLSDTPSNQETIVNKITESQVDDAISG